MGSARLRLVCLWISQVARVLADNALRLWVVFYLLTQGANYENSAWHLVTLIFMLPALALAPVNGAVGNSLPKPIVLRLAAALGLAGVALALAIDGAWLPGWGLVALTAAVYGPVRYAMLPAAAHDARWPLTRINGWFEMGAAAAIVAGYVLTLQEHDSAGSLTRAIPWIVLSLHAVAVVFAAPVQFVSDLRRDEGPGAAVAGFFRDCRRIFAEPEARGCLLALGLSRGLITGLMGPFIVKTFRDDGHLQPLIYAGCWLFGGVALGSLLAGAQKHPRRVLGLVPWGATGFAIGLLFAPGGEPPSELLAVLLGVSFGLVNVPLAATFQAALPADARGNGMAVRNFTDYLAVALIAGLLFALGQWADWSPAAQLWLIAGLAMAAAMLAWTVLRRETVEQLIEVPLSLLYHIRGQGPGLDDFPTRGPLLVMANHSSWLDPMWLAKILPRRLIPMMTSVFFDLPVMRWMMVHLARAIRVEASGFRREVPEIREAIAVLDRGECLVIFPEGSMRRLLEVPVRQFGQGVWHILKERPNTPVIVCWIEGGWGSYFSYFNGPPTKNKRLDFRRPIEVAVGPAQTIPADLLTEHRKLRAHLMQVCLETRGYLGLDILATGKEEEEESEGSSVTPQPPAPEQDQT